MPGPVTVWAVELGRGMPADEVKGTLQLERDALAFTPRDQTLPVVRIPFDQVRKVRRLRGSPVLLVDRAARSEPRRTAFYFAQPPPIAALRGDPVESPPGLGAFRNPRRKARRDNAGYLGLMNKEKKAILQAWVEEVRAAISR